VGNYPARPCSKIEQDGILRDPEGSGLRQPRPIAGGDDEVETYTERCPSEEELRAFQLGDLPEAALDVVARHLAGCAHCETRARERATVVDPIRDAIRHRSDGIPPDLPASPGLDTLVHPRYRAVPGRYSFLLPAVQPDEIGRLGNYRVLRLLGRGGMAFVFAAEDATLHRPVALKVMRPDLHAEAAGCERFLTEARRLAAIKHEHLITVYQADLDGDAFSLPIALLKP